jgi:Ran GTPase-activating protein (RanGAP) involved in mRNA processing and transport
MLSIRGNSIGDIGVSSISTILRNPNSTLEKLDISRNFGRNSISDIGINALTNALVNNRMLKELSMYENPAVTTAGWVDFSTVLRNPTSALEVIYVSNDSINDEVMQSFADALANNNKLRELNICPVIAYNHITPDGYAAITNILCDTSSILSTYHSNHTLE